MSSCMKKQKRGKKKIILGLTGSFGSGKSTVAGIFDSLGAKVIDADVLARECVTPGKKAYKKIVKFFGASVLRKDKTIDRARLGQLVFNDLKRLKKLNSIVHPEVISQMKKQIKQAREEIVVLDVPLLIEAGLENLVDKIIVVKTTRAKQLKRVRNKTSLGNADILKRIRAQLSLSAKEHLADFVIDNSGSISKTKEQVEKVWRSLDRILRSRDKFGHTTYVH